MLKYKIRKRNTYLKKTKPKAKAKAKEKKKTLLK
jgi:hypothetical protein